MTQIDRRYSVAEGTAIKAPCRVATTANITLGGLQTLDGVTVAEHDRVLVKNQTDQTLNGIYEASTGNWRRTKDFDGAYDVVQGTRVDVVLGTVGGSRTYSVTTAEPIVFGSSNIVFASPNVLAGPPGLDGGTIQFFTTRAQAIGTAINTSLTRIVVDRYDALSIFSPHYYKPGTSGGPLAFQDNGGIGNWFELDLSTGYVNGAWCGVRGGDYTADTAGFALMRTIARATGAAMVLPKGDFMLTAGILIDWNYGGIEGVTPLETRIFFNAATSDQTVFEYFKSGDNNGASFCYLKNLSIIGASALRKKALSTKNTSNFHIENVFIQNWTGGTGDGSIGWDHRGRELTRAERITIAADICLDIQQNPDRALVGGIDCDFLHITNHWLLGFSMAKPLIRRGDAVNVSSLLIESGSWNLGVNGFDSFDTTSTQSSFGFIFRNIRYEQGAAGSVMFKFNRTSASRDCKVRIRDCETGGRLFYGRGVRDVTLSGCECDVIGDYAVDADGANCHIITIDDCFWNTGSLVSLPSFAIREATGTLNPGPSAPALPTSGQFISTTINPAGVGTWKGIKSSSNQQAHEWVGTFTLAHLASITLDPFAKYAADHGLIEISSSNAEGGIVLYRSSGLNQIAGSTNFSVTTIPSKLSVIFVNASLVSVTNSLGSTQEVTVRVLLSAPLSF
jgi:uncharacterized cupin superfamily protein